MTEPTNASARPDIGPPLSSACVTCPWLLVNQETPPLDHADCVIDPDYYEAVGRRELWADLMGTGQGARDGFRVRCHVDAGVGTPTRWCSGSDALQARALLRFFETGERGALTSEAPWRIAAELFEAHPWNEGHESAAAWVVRVANTDLLNPALTYPGVVEAPTPDELARWQRLLDAAPSAA